MQDDRASYDVAVIGAGINGAGIALDAALRGLKVIVLDQDDLCSATSAISSRLIHGGLRYLEYAEFPLVFESLRERITLRRLAPHLIQPLRINIPVYASARRGPLLIRLGMILYDLLSVGKTVPGHDMLGRQKAIDAEPGLQHEGLRAMARYYDAQVEFAERWVLEILLAARTAGADVRTHNRVDRIVIEDGAVRGLEFTDRITGASQACDARVVVNAGGPWVDEVLATADGAQTQFIGGTKGSHIVVSGFDGAPQDAYYVEAAADGRPFFIIPWNGLYLIGTTDIRYDGDLNHVRASDAEVDYLLDETNRVFPAAQLTRRSIHYAYSGVWPLPRRKKGPEGSITRKHIIRANRKIARGLFSIIGGKLTTYRNLAEQAVDKLAKPLGRKLPACRTQDLELPGAFGRAEAAAALDASDVVTPAESDRLLRIYGGRAAGVLDLATGEQLPLVEAETVFAIRDEMARTLTDIVHRRLMIGLDADQGRPMYARVAAAAAKELGWSDEEREAQLQALQEYSDSLQV
ncbi:MAG: glycerol-3-phosphate dehydrogenase/oxidase [Woeseiaceae bacterium]|nr:glycerol-3-phosphate dehydrogenase/oxidase [Woeseiaceae bacterium]